MSSPSPEIQKNPTDHTYQSSETSEHSLLKHTFNCSEKAPINCPKADSGHSHCLGQSKGGHHHGVIGFNSTSHVHPVSVHVHASPKDGHVTKISPPSCTCHLQNEEDGNQDGHDGGVGRKLDADDRIEISPMPPALPPRPPPRPRTDGLGTLTNRSHLRGGKTVVPFTISSVDYE